MFAQFSLLSLCFQILYWECSITKSVFWMNYELSHKSSNAKLFLMTWMRHDRNCKSSGSYNVLSFLRRITHKKTMVGGQINILDMRKRKGICYHSHMAPNSFVNIDFFAFLWFATSFSIFYSQVLHCKSANVRVQC